MNNYRLLFSPLKIGSMPLKNRIFFGAHNPRFFNEEEAPNDRAIEYYTARARGGAAMMDLSGLNVAPLSTFGPPPAIQDEKKIDQFKKLVDAVHKYDVRIIVQLRDHTRHSSQTYGGVQRGPSAYLEQYGFQRGPVPSRTAHFLLPGNVEIPHVLDIEEIKSYIEAFGNAARFMKKVGMDGVEINSWEMNLNALFLSPLSNIRNDQYGGSFKNRLRFNMEVIESIRAEVGNEFPVGMSIDGDQFVEGGLSQDDWKNIAHAYEGYGKIDFFRVGIPPVSSLPMNSPSGSLVYLAAGLKETVKVPVITMARINDPVQADKILVDGKADLVEMVRALICDPELPNKAREGRLEEIRKCIACNERCRKKTYSPNTPVSCALNPEAGREKAWTIKPAATIKKVVIVGGGAAGLETARVAALRGHKVSIYEQAHHLGGQLNIAAKAPGRTEFNEVTRYYEHQMKLLSVDVNLNTRISANMVLGGNFDAVVLATGSEPFIPSLPGTDQPNVVEARDVLQGKVEVGRKVVVVAYEHHNLALCTADFIADKDRIVEVIGGALYLGSQLDLITLGASYASILRKKGILTPLTELREIKGKTVFSYNVLSNLDHRIDDVDTIVISTLGKADDSLYQELKGKVKNLYIVGQCSAPRMLADSILDGAFVARFVL